MPKPTRKPLNPADIVRASRRFLQWKPAKLTLRELEESDIVMEEQHYTPSDLAKMWGVSVQTIRELFKQEDGVLKIGSAGTRNRRAYQTLRIPQSVAERVHTRLSC
jgi:DNA-binding CsgD family transcriptional regulator